jgi:hypothetical protein
LDADARSDARAAFVVIEQIDARDSVVALSLSGS